MDNSSSRFLLLLGGSFFFLNAAWIEVQVRDVVWTWLPSTEFRSEIQSNSSLYSWRMDLWKNSHASLMTCLFAMVSVFLYFKMLFSLYSLYIELNHHCYLALQMANKLPQGHGSLTVSHQCQDQLAKNQPGLTFMNFSVRLVVRRVGENGNANSIQNWNCFLKEPKLISQFGPISLSN